MSASAKINLGDAIFNGIEENPFLNELYDSILYNYALKKFELTSSRQSRMLPRMLRSLPDRRTLP